MAGVTIIGIDCISRMISLGPILLLLVAVEQLPSLVVRHAQIMHQMSGGSPPKNSFAKITLASHLRGVLKIEETGVEGVAERP